MDVSLSKKKIGIVGLGYVGLPLAVEFGKKLNVIGFDTNSERIKQLQNFNDENDECSASDIREARFLSLTPFLDEMRICDFFIITVPTPIDNSKNPDLSILKNACASIGKIMSKGSTVIIESTVYPGVTEEVCVPELEKNSGFIFNEDFYCGYSPERVNPGDKINTLTKIKKITSGSTENTAQEVKALYDLIIDAGTVPVGSIKIAEAAKVIENCQRDLNIAFVNELSVIFERLKIDTMEVLAAAESKWNFLPFRPGMVGGHCIGVDPYYLTHKAEELGYNPQVILAGRKINDNMAFYVAGNIVKKMAKNGVAIANSRIGIFGVTFKENCPDIRNSKVLDLVVELESWGAEIMIVDSRANESEVKKDFKKSLSKFEDCDNLDAVVIAVGHNEYRDASLSVFYEKCKKTHTPVLADIKCIFEKQDAIAMGFDIFRL